MTLNELKIELKNLTDDVEIIRDTLYTATRDTNDDLLDVMRRLHNSRMALQKLMEAEDETQRRIPTES